MREPAPPYANEGPHALWHVSESASIERFAPHVSATAELDEPLVWASEEAWLGRMRTTDVFAYRLPERAFEPHPSVGGYWISRETVEPLEVRLLGDLVALHEDAGIELRVVANLWPLWNEVVASTLELSGMRLRSAQPAP